MGLLNGLWNTLCFVVLLCAAVALLYEGISGVVAFLIGTE